MSYYVPVENPVRFSPSFFSVVIFIISLVITGISWLLYLFGLAILVFPEIRTFYLNWAFISLISGFLISRISKWLKTSYGVTKLSFDKSNFLIDSWGKKVPYSQVLHIEKIPRKLFGLLPVKFDIFTSDAKIRINLIRWKHSKAMEEIFDRYQENVSSIYVMNAYYKNSIKNSLMKILNTTQGKIGFVIIMIYTFMALIGGIAYVIDPPVDGKMRSWILWNPKYLTYVSRDIGILEPPNSEFWFGTDFGGRDIFSRMIFGTTITMMISILVAVIVISFITILGLSSAIYGGSWDGVVTRVSDVLLTFPQVVWIVLISVFSTPFRIGIPGGFYLAVYLGMSLVMWPLGTRLVRSEVLEALSAEYIQAIELVGASRFWIIRHHVLPKVVPTLFLLFFYQLSDIIIGISLLGYLGFGSESTLVWGSDLTKAFEAPILQDEWWTIIFPSLFIFGIVLGLTLFSDALRDTYAARYRGGIQTTLHSSMGGN